MIVPPPSPMRNEKIVEKSLSQKYSDAFDEREKNINKIPKFLSPFQTEDLQITYGAEQEINVEIPTEPPSPNTSLTKAAKYVLHLKAKGFNATSDKNKEPDDVYERIVNPMRRKRNEQAMRQKPEETKTNKSTNLEDYQGFWHSLDSVTRIVKEIRSLPVEDCTTKLKMEELFHDNVTSIVRIMKHDGLLDGPKSRQKLNSSMLHFITEIRKSRASIFETMFKNHEINWNLLNESQKKEFIKYKPEPIAVKNSYIEMVTAEDKQKNEDVDAKILQQISDNVQMLPSMYRFQARPGYERQLREHFDKETPKLLSQISRQLNSCLGMRPRPATVIPKITNKEPVKEHRPRVLMSQLAQRATRPSFVEPLPKQELRRSDGSIYKMYWEFSDPLGSTRDGDFRCPQKTFGELTDNIDINLNTLEDTEFDIPEALKNIKDPPGYYERRTFMIDSADSVPASQRLSRLKSLKSLKSVPNVSIEEEEEEEETGEEEDDQHLLKKPTTEEKIKNVLVGSQTCGYGKSPDDDMKYLMGQTFELAHDTTGEALYKRLEEIWNQLGFTVMQKLDMAIKYTQNSDENSRLSDSMNFWEGALVTVERYQKSYRELKDYMQLEIDKLDETNTNFTRLVSDVRAAEELLISLSQQMKQTYGDDLIISRRKIGDLIADRRNKIARIILSKNTPGI